MRIILGSQSERRKEILGYFSVPFTQVASHFDEESVVYQNNPSEHAILLSQKKSEALASQFPYDVILTADTVVYCDGNLYNKPADEKQAFYFLKTFCGRWQSVFTGVTVRKGHIFYSDVEETRLLFNCLTDEEIKQFHKHCYFLDKAGGYAIEKAGNLIVSRIEGCYDNVMGLPMNTTQKLLLKVGINLWDFLNPF